MESTYHERISNKIVTEIYQYLNCVGVKSKIMKRNTAPKVNTNMYFKFASKNTRSRPL